MGEGSVVPRGHDMGVSLWGTDVRGASGTAAGEPLILGLYGGALVGQSLNMAWC